MTLAQYCHLVDVLRKFNPQLTEAALTNNDYIGNADTDQVTARIRAVSDAFDDQTRNPCRTVRVGSPGAPATYEYHDANGTGRRAPIRVDLDQRRVIPPAPTTDDTIEIRTGRDEWRDITAEEGDRWVLEPEAGTLRLFDRLLRLVWWEAPDNRYLRTTYRFGGLGGSRTAGGQTELAASVSDSATTLDVVTAGRLVGQGVLLVDNSEYVQIESVDYEADTLTVTRAQHATAAAAHDAGAPVHYCPLNVRDAVAAKTARELLRYEDWVDELIEAGQGLGARDKMEAWEQSWEQALAKHAGVRSL